MAAATVAQPRTISKAFYATVYDEPAQLVQVDGIIYVVTEDDIQPFEVEMAPFTCVLGEVGLADTQHILDAIVHRGYAWIACHRQQEVA
jgi:hypothetical protein